MIMTTAVIGCLMMIGLIRTVLARFTSVTRAFQNDGGHDGDEFGDVVNVRALLSQLASSHLHSSATSAARMPVLVPLPPQLLPLPLPLLLFVIAVLVLVPVLAVSVPVLLRWL